MSIASSIMRRHRWLVWTGVGVVLIAGFVLWFFEPQALLLDDTVSETAPRVDEAPESRDEGGSKGSPRGVVSKGDFRSLAHDARGTALIIEASGGDTYLRFEEFEVENGPDLKVYLSRAKSDAPEDELAVEIVDLGELKGNVGDQNYLVPASVDLTMYRSAVVWCKRFSVGFAVAPVNVRGS
jgi:Electron transfer DM13